MRRSFRRSTRQKKNKQESKKQETAIDSNHKKKNNFAEDRDKLTDDEDEVQNKSNNTPNRRRLRNRHSFKKNVTALAEGNPAISKNRRELRLAEAAVLNSPGSGLLQLEEVGLSDDDDFAVNLNSDADLSPSLLSDHYKSTSDSLDQLQSLENIQGSSDASEYDKYKSNPNKSDPQKFVMTSQDIIPGSEMTTHKPQTTQNTEILHQYQKQQHLNQNETEPNIINVENNNNKRRRISFIEAMSLDEGQASKYIEVNIYPPNYYEQRVTSLSHRNSKFFSLPVFPIDKEFASYHKTNADSAISKSVANVFEEHEDKGDVPIVQNTTKDIINDKNDLKSFNENTNLQEVSLTNEEKKSNEVSRGNNLFVTSPTFKQLDNTFDFIVENNKEKNWKTIVYPNSSEQSEKSSLSTLNENSNQHHSSEQLQLAYAPSKELEQAQKQRLERKKILENAKQLHEEEIKKLEQEIMVINLAEEAEKHALMIHRQDLEDTAFVNLIADNDTEHSVEQAQIKSPSHLINKLKSKLTLKKQNRNSTKTSTNDTLENISKNINTSKSDEETTHESSKLNKKLSPKVQKQTNQPMLVQEKGSETKKKSRPVRRHHSVSTIFSTNKASEVIFPTHRKKSSRKTSTDSEISDEQTYTGHQSKDGSKHTLTTSPKIKMPLISTGFNKSSEKTEAIKINFKISMSEKRTSAAYQKQNYNSDSQSINVKRNNESDGSYFRRYSKLTNDWDKVTEFDTMPSFSHTHSASNLHKVIEEKLPKSKSWESKINVLGLQQNHNMADTMSNDTIYRGKFDNAKTLEVSGNKLTTPIILQDHLNEVTYSQQSKEATQNKGQTMMIEQNNPIAANQKSSDSKNIKNSVSKRKASLELHGKELILHLFEWKDEPTLKLDSPTISDGSFEHTLQASNAINSSKSCNANEQVGTSEYVKNDEEATKAKANKQKSASNTQNISNFFIKFISGSISPKKNKMDKESQSFIKEKNRENVATSTNKGESNCITPDSISEIDKTSSSTNIIRNGNVVNSGKTTSEDAQCPTRDSLLIANYAPQDNAEHLQNFESSSIKDEGHIRNGITITDIPLMLAEADENSPPVPIFKAAQLMYMEPSSTKFTSSSSNHFQYNKVTVRHAEQKTSSTNNRNNVDSNKAVNPGAINIDFTLNKTETSQPSLLNKINCTSDIMNKQENCYCDEDDDVFKSQTTYENSYPATTSAINPEHPNGDAAKSKSEKHAQDEDILEKAAKDALAIKRHDYEYSGSSSTEAGASGVTVKLFSQPTTASDCSLPETEYSSGNKTDSEFRSTNDLNHVKDAIKSDAESKKQQLTVPLS